MAQNAQKAVVAPKPVARPEEHWHRARLIPTTGIGGQEEQEQRATSALLAVLHAVPAFSHAVLSQAGAPAGRVGTYIEVQFPDDAGNSLRPDGAVIVEWGRKRWIGLLEVKTGGAALRAEQVNAYLDVARARGYDALITVSNHITASSEEIPVRAKPHKTVALRHLSWWQILTEARLHHAEHTIANPDQAWILGELIAYLESGRAGTGGFDDMGSSWVAVRDAAHLKTLRMNTAGLADVVSRWEQLINFISLHLTQDLGRRVVATWPKELDATGRQERHARSLVETGQLHASLRVPDAVGPLEITADLWTRRLVTAVSLEAPHSGKPRTRITWLLRQLSETQDPIRVQVRYPNVRDSVDIPLQEARLKPERLLLAADPRRDPRQFQLVLGRDLGTKRGNGRGSFVKETADQTVDFYRSVVQHLRPWRPPAPTLPPAAAQTSEGEPSDAPAVMVDRGTSESPAADAPWPSAPSV